MKTSGTLSRRRASIWWVTSQAASSMSPPKKKQRNTSGGGPSDNVGWFRRTPSQQSQFKNDTMYCLPHSISSHHPKPKSSRNPWGVHPLNLFRFPFPSTGAPMTITSSSGWKSEPAPAAVNQRTWCVSEKYLPGHPTLLKVLHWMVQVPIRNGPKNPWRQVLVCSESRSV